MNCCAWIPLRGRWLPALAWLLTAVIAAACAGKPTLTEASAVPDSALTAAADLPPADEAMPGADLLLTGPDKPRCANYAEPKVMGTVTDAELTELSGIAASSRHPGVLWVLNDGGNKPRLYALDGQGKWLATYKLKDVPSDDWEAVGLGPCSQDAVAAGSPCLYVADTGDNALTRKLSHILRMAEPKQIPGPGEDRSKGVDADQVEVFPFHFPDGPQDVEAMAVLADGRVLLFNKRDDGQSTVYRLTLTPGAVAVAEKLGTLMVRDPPLVSGLSLRVTAADLTPDGRWLLLKTYFRLFLFDLGTTLADPAEAADAALSTAVPSLLPLGFENQGESVTWDPAGGYWHVSEGTGSSLFRVDCKSAP